MYEQRNEAVSLEEDLHCEIGDKGDARQIQVKGGFMGFIMWIEENRGDQSVCITRHHRGTYGIGCHQQLRENAREAGQREFFIGQDGQVLESSRFLDWFQGGGGETEVP